MSSCSPGWASDPACEGYKTAENFHLRRLRWGGEGGEGCPEAGGGEAEGAAGLHQGHHLQDAREGGEGQTEVGLDYCTL